MDNLISLIKKKGYSVAGFARTVLDMEYTTFHYNVKNGTFKYKQLKIMLLALDCKFEDLEKPVKQINK